jgi:hypothetical protein
MMLTVMSNSVVVFVNKIVDNQCPIFLLSAITILARHRQQLKFRGFVFLLIDLFTCLVSRNPDNHSLVVKSFSTLASPHCKHFLQTVAIVEPMTFFLAMKCLANNFLMIIQ